MWKQSTEGATMTTKKMVLFTALLIVSANGVLAQQQSHNASDKPSKIVYDGDMAALLSSLAEHYKVQIGFETVPLQPKPRIKIDTSFATVEDVLDAIVTSDARYRWQARDGFIDVYPQTGSCPLLDTMISEFQLSNTDWLLASQILTSQPEVQSQMLTLHLSRRDLPRVSREATVSVLSISLRDVTLRRALHEITKASGRSFWIFERPRGETQAFSISAR
jgi:hypothetical protein